MTACCLARSMGSRRNGVAAKSDFSVKRTVSEAKSFLPTEMFCLQYVYSQL